MIHLYNKVSSKISAIIIAFDAGARAESDKYTAGMAHFLEHMVFKGSEERDYLKIPREVGFLGGNINAFTSNELVAFYITVPYENTEKAMEILSDIVFNPIFPEEEFIKEKEVVKEEELSGNDSVDNFVYETFCQKFFEKRSAIPVIGTQESISKFKRTELIKFHKKFYKKSNAIVSFAGNFSKSQSKKLLTKYFGKSTNKIKHPVEIYEPQYKELRTEIITRPKLEHSYVWLCYPGLPIGSENEVAEDMLFSIFGQGMDSRLFTEVREKHGLCYGINAQSLSQRDYSAVLITSATRQENVEELLKLVNLEIEKIKNEYVTEEELERARNKFRASNYAIAESSLSLAKTALIRKFYNLCNADELEEQAKSVTAEDIRYMANKLFDDSKKMILICKSEEII